LRLLGMPLSNGVESAFTLNSNTFSDKKKMLFRNFGVKVITQMTQILRRLQITQIVLRRTFHRSKFRRGGDRNDQDPASVCAIPAGNQ